MYNSASFAINGVLISQIWYITILMDRYRVANALDYICNKSKPSKSLIAGENVCAVSERLNSSFRIFLYIERKLYHRFTPLVYGIETIAIYFTSMAQEIDENR